MGAPVRVAVEADHAPVVHGPVDDGGGHVRVAEHASPAAEFDVRGEDHALTFIRIGDDLEQQAAAFLIDGHVAELVDDQEPRLADHGEFLVEPVVRFGAQQAPGQPGGRRRSASPCLPCMLCGRGRWPGASCPCREARTGRRPRAARRISSDSSDSRPQSTGKRTGVQSYPSSSLDWGNPACRSRRARFERPRDAISSRIHASMNAICAAVASSRLSARTCRAGGRPRASSMIASIRRPVEARRRLVSCSLPFPVPVPCLRSPRGRVC